MSPSGESLAGTDLPLTIAEQLGYFRKEGLNLTISDFSGGLAGAEGGRRRSADVVSGAYEHTLNMQPRASYLQCFVQQGRAPQIASGSPPPERKTIESPKDLKGLTVGVSAPGSSTHMISSITFPPQASSLSDISVIGVGLGATAITAIRSGQIDAVSNTDPVMTKLEQDGDVKIIADTRTLRGTEQVFGGPMPAGCLYAPVDFIRRIGHGPGAPPTPSVRPTNGSSRFPPGRAPHVSRILSARRQGAVPCSRSTR